MHTLITYAVDPEFAPWPKLCKFETLSSSGFAIQRTRIGSNTADFLITGMGPERAESALKCVENTPYDACICAGFAGSLRPEHQLGDILIPEKIRAAEGSDAILCDPALLRSAQSVATTWTLLSSPKIIASASEKAALAPLADAVDMESFAVISHARSQGIPAVAIRVISDSYDQEMPVDFSRCLDEKGQVSTAAVLRMIAGQPGKIGTLMRLGRESKSAAEKLARFLHSYLDRLPAQSFT